MPVARYFFFVGGALLALLFVFDASAPNWPVADRSETGIDLPMVRIHTDRKWPEAVVFDTRIATIVPAISLAPAQALVPAPAIVADIPASLRVRNAFAQFEPAIPKGPESKLQRKRKVAKHRMILPTVLAAQQPRFGFLANN
jgi:hypothetical protein